MKDTGLGLGSPSQAAKESASVVTIRQKSHSSHVTPFFILFEVQRLRPIAATGGCHNMPSVLILYR